MQHKYVLIIKIINGIKNNLKFFSILGLITGGSLIIYYCSTINFYPSGLVISDTIFFLWTSSIFGFFYSIITFIFFIASVAWVVILNRPINYLFKKFLPQDDLSFSTPKIDKLLIISFGILANVAIFFISFIKEYSYLLMSFSVAMIGFIYILIINIDKKPIRINNQLNNNETTSTNNDNPEDTKLLSPEAVKIFLYFLIYAIPLLFAQIGGDVTRSTFETMGIRQNNVDILIKSETFESILEKYKTDGYTFTYRCNNGCLLENANILFTGIGTITKLELSDPKGHITICIPNESIHLIAKKKLLTHR